MKKKFRDGLHLEAKRRFGLRDLLFPEQQKVVDHPARKKCVVTPRRGGKTFLVCVWMLLWALTKKPPPGQPPLKYLYIALTRPSAKDIAWTILKNLNTIFNLGCEFVDSLLEVRCPNGALIMLRGADQENWMDRLEGQAFKLIIIDEAGLYKNIDMEKLVLYVLGPMIVDYKGTIALIGRPGKICHGFFWDITRPEIEKRKPTGWEYFNWTSFDNPHVAEEIKEEIEEIKRNNPEAMYTPDFQRNYLGLWVPDSEGNVYRFNEDLNLTVPGWTHVADSKDRYVGGFDFGWNDRTTVGVLMWNPNSPRVIYLESKGQEEWLLSDVLAHIDTLILRYPGIQFYGDPARKQLFMEVQTRFGQCIFPAPKEEKRDHIEIWNAAALAGNILIHRATNEEYVNELLSLKKYWPPRAKKQEWQEHPSQHNDFCDQGLYAFRNAYAFLHTPEKQKPKPGSPEAYEAEEKKILEAEMRRFRSKKNAKWWAA